MPNLAFRFGSAIEAGPLCTKETLKLYSKKQTSLGERKNQGFIFDDGYKRQSETHLFLDLIKDPRKSETYDIVIITTCQIVVGEWPSPPKSKGKKSKGAYLQAAGPPSKDKWL
ncbi:4113_t:CDS:2 [Paraglomus brasilianum]|uniref:4113_t:CDS:1 n=1 Tax=Paraglomus brasilianum TaxID=144538 RepID=A0A9N9FLE4_9GLOM|nr:4113_t:CDS:2 [Paraglomus brasilianum]